MVQNFTVFVFPSVNSIISTLSFIYFHSGLNLKTSSIADSCFLSWSYAREVNLGNEIEPILVFTVLLLQIIKSRLITQSIGSKYWIMQKSG